VASPTLALVYEAAPEDHPRIDAIRRHPCSVANRPVLTAVPR
jgi:hypothetical protein